MRNARTSLLDRLRGATALRVLALCAAMLTSQDALTCAIENATALESALVSPDLAPDETPDDSGCCALCPGCAQSGGCCGSAAGPRALDERFMPARTLDTRLGVTALAPWSWTPPTLLRPPIAAA